MSLIIKTQAIFPKNPKANKGKLSTNMLFNFPEFPKQDFVESILKEVPALTECFFSRQSLKFKFKAGNDRNEIAKCVELAFYREFETYILANGEIRLA